MPANIGDHVDHVNRYWVIFMMEISSRGRYATRIMMALALHEGQAPARKREIAKAENISADYVEQILMRLRQAGLVTSYRGAKGGFTLARPAETITVADIIEVMEGSIAMAPCANEPCERASSCVTREVWHRADAAIRKVFEETTLASMAEQARKQHIKQELSFHI